MTFASGVCAAVLSPLVTTVGFLVWEYHWPRSHSAFALNLYKCALASGLFLGTLAVMALVHNNDTATTTEVRFLGASLVTIDDDTEHPFTRQQSIGYLMLSSMIGIVIGDILWLQALTILGTVRVVFMDALKPFGAALFGAVFLHEPVRWTILLGITLTVLGIVCIGLEQAANEKERNRSGDESLPGASVRNAVANDYDVDPSSFASVPDHYSRPTEDRVEEGSLEDVAAASTMKEDVTNAAPRNTSHDVDTASPNGVPSSSDEPIAAPVLEPNRLPSEPLNPPPAAAAAVVRVLPIWAGYAMSLINVVLDTYGSVLTKEYGVALSIWEINFIRFGFAGAVLLLVSITMTFYHWLVRDVPPTSHVPNIPSSSSASAGMNASLPTDTSPVADGGSGTKEPTQPNDTSSWYALPIKDATMTKRMWGYVSLGVVLVTYMAPTLSNYALFEISLALTLTLTSIGPLYALPLAYGVRRYFDPALATPPSFRAGLGAMGTVAGILLLAYTGKDDDAL